jgi:hypothetical protein
VSISSLNSRAWKEAFEWSRGSGKGWCVFAVLKERSERMASGVGIVRAL